MDLIQIVLLAFVQGLTEFLPISSSGHLVLAPNMLGWRDQGVAFDVAVHAGTLTAVVTYFRHELLAMASAWFRSVAGGPATPDSRLAWAVIWGTVPVVLAGLLLVGPVVDQLRHPLIVAATTAGFGVLLWVADIRGKRSRDEHSLTWKDVAVIGVAQALALVPGTSRSGITMTAGLMLGLTRAGAARFSFLLSVPVILAAALYELLELVQNPEPVDWTALALGAGLSAAVAYAAIHYFLSFLERIGMAPFAIYRLVLAGLIVVVAT